MTEMKRLTEEECYRLFREQNTPDRVIRHCQEVSRVAAVIADALNRNGVAMDVELVRISALIHDVARVQDHHEIVGARLLRSLGYEREAEIVEAHMTHMLAPLSEATETDILCLADRTVTENHYTGVDGRFDYLLHKRPWSEEREKRLEDLKELTRSFMREIEGTIGQTVDSLFAPSLEQLLEQVEKPARYIGGETNMVVKDPEKMDVRFAFAFPDLYEIGMSYMGLQILYDVTNRHENLYLERVFSPAPDMEELMRKHHVPLFTLETKTPVKQMDVFGFTLQYEMSFPTILNMMELAEVPLLSRDRGEGDPLMIAGGPCAVNPEPLADFFDLFMIGDGEELLPAVLNAYGEAKREGLSKREYLQRVSKLTGVYVPSFYDVQYHPDGTVKEFVKLWEGAPDRIEKAILPDLNRVPFPEKPIVPIVEAVHDRAVVETFRGCTRGCRFCQAGMSYRPVRERSEETIKRLAEQQLKNTGHDELSLLSLSTSDYSNFEGLATELMDYCTKRNVSLSLPSLRLDSFSFNVLNEIQKYKKSGLTFAPEAGTQRLRDVINKGITEEDIFSAVEQAVELGWRTMKFYFMDGLPTETDEDLRGIGEIARKAIEIFRKSGKRGRFNVTCSVSNFVPKPFTPFQWAPQASSEELRQKHVVLEHAMPGRNARLTYHDDAVSVCEGVLARGDRRMSALLLKAHEAGCRLDAWTEYFHRDVWKELLENWEIDYKFYTERKRSFDEVMPWDLIDPGVSKEFLVREAKKAEQGLTTQDCRYGCVGCGVNRKTTCGLGGIYE
ncbi:TIGR03960 family B12-binding radical SAM protein [Eubacterium pyruvativorans]|nr:TIGR03960 family B12-binding radical SAM protein [Eubacterium pyruvativorans]MDY4050040.1 TIGR03960 family B12-binding radical SAM protein [Eubacterium pyruvativorans]HAT82389.1 TIGR03960 family radical SAM protein [Eubacterium sp.]